MPTVKKRCEFLTKHFGKQPCCITCWLPDDVQSVASNYDVKLSDEEVEDILYDLEDGFDAEYGIKWNDIDFYVCEIVSKPGYKFHADLRFMVDGKIKELEQELSGMTFV